MENRMMDKEQKNAAKRKNEYSTFFILDEKEPKHYKIQKDNLSVNVIKEDTQEFLKFISSLLRRSCLKEEYIQELLNDKECVYAYIQAFMHKSSNVDINYDLYELLGDKIAMACLMEYFYKKFSAYRHPSTVSFYTLLIKKYGSKNTFYLIAEKLGFFNWVIADEASKSTDKKPILEDTFESFCGVTNFLLNYKIREGVGYAFIYEIICSVFEEFIVIDTSYTKLTDPITLLKEQWDILDNKKKIIQLFKLRYTSDKLSNRMNRLDNGKVEYIILYEENVLSKGYGNIKSDAEQDASRNLLMNINRLDKSIFDFDKKNEDFLIKMKVI